jgi:hypothetical protein
MIMSDTHRDSASDKVTDKQREESADIAPTEPDPAEGANDAPPPLPGSPKG